MSARLLERKKMASIRDRRPQLVFILMLSSILTHVLGNIQATNAASSTSSSSETTSSSQPLWSYQVKPNSYANVAGNQAGHYSSAPSILDAFNGLSQRQGALSSSPFLSILPIILIAAGGMLLLLPFLTMMIASPFSGGAGFGAYNNGPFGYPQVGAMNKKRSLADSFGQRGLIDLIEHVSSSIEEMARKYSPSTNSGGGNSGQFNKRAKAMNLQLQQPNESASQTQSQQQVNHKPVGSAQTASGTIISSSTNEESNSNNNLSGSS